MGRKPQTNDYSLLYERAARERDEARAEAEVLAEQVARMNVEGLRDDRRAAAEVARWKAEAERLREAIKPRGLSAGGGMRPDATMPTHDEDGTAQVRREARCRRLTRGCCNEQAQGDPIRRYLWLCTSRAFGHVNWHTTDGPVDPVYDGLDGWDLTRVDLDVAGGGTDA